MRPGLKYLLYTFAFGVVLLSIGNGVWRARAQLGASDAAHAACKQVNRWNSGRNGYADCLRAHEARN
ncbi:hypothetical protein [Sphingomonas colocasiae]|uniref:Uncharacterized protein n=1 Tax=Sphingomonas colocasiae TaxID=1848973 RepID=A0ABS7PUX3_9SPHN|nr:hypothetical protein [Sphingomonas colocasiae]MBY8825066.1 hypothetical protein [Sphingomonas colocasiae]